MELTGYAKTAQLLMAMVARSDGLGTAVPVLAGRAIEAPLSGDGVVGAVLATATHHDTADHDDELAA